MYSSSSYLHHDIQLPEGFVLSQVVFKIVDHNGLLRDLSSRSKKYELEFEFEFVCYLLRLINYQLDLMNELINRIV